MRGLLAKRSARWSERAFVAEGAELLRTALAAGRAIESVYVAADATDEATTRAAEAALDAGARLFSLAPGVLERVADTVTPQPVMAVLPMLDVPAIGGGADPALVVVMVDVRDPGNAGTVLRTADAAGVGRVVFSGDSVDPYNPKTVRASAGSLFHVPISLDDDAVALARAYGATGYRTLATLVHEGEDYAGFDWRTRSVLFLGNESSGLPQEVIDAVSGSVVVPMEGRAESLNVGVACAVVCFEALRQRRLGAHP